MNCMRMKLRRGGVASIGEKVNALYSQPFGIMRLRRGDEPGDLVEVEKVAVRST